MISGYCLDEKEIRIVQATLQFAKNLGLVDKEDLMALEQRRVALNTENQEKLVRGEIVYGLTSYSQPVYLQHELTRFKLDFAREIEQIKNKYEYRNISVEEKKNFYLDNMDLFTRYHGDTFSYEEVELIIEKRIREAEYEKNIKDILCQRP